MNYRGLNIYRTRIQRNWSQAGLCKGICTVSYLSKIETGKAEPSEEILQHLLDRLGLKPDQETERKAAELADQCWELLLDGRREKLAERLKNIDVEQYRAVPAWMDLTLLSFEAPLDAALEPCMDTRQLALQRILQGKAAEAARLLPNAFTFLSLGITDYNAGNDSAAVDHLQTAYELASRDGAARIMLEAKLFLGNTYCNRQDLLNMERHYQVGKRLAEDLQDERALRVMGYNTASAWIEVGRYEDAYKWFSAQTSPTLMSLHKLAICCEKTGRTAEALAALERAEAAEAAEQRSEAVEKMLAVVRFRLAHPDYLHCDAYGALLLDCFACCRTRLPQGYAAFHLPWVVEWYTAARQYKKVCELLTEFPDIRI